MKKVVNFSLYWFRILDYIGGILFFLLFYIRIKFSSKSTILFVDLDNTIFNTWPNLKNEYFKYIDLQVFDGTVNFVKNRINDNVLLVFLSHRPIKSYNQTSKSLNFHFHNFINLWQVSFVPRVNWKWYYFKTGELIFLNTIVIDDLSYNHENGNVLFYQDLIDKINLSSITYFDYNFIKELNNDK